MRIIAAPLILLITATIVVSCGGSDTTTQPSAVPVGDCPDRATPPTGEEKRFAVVYDRTADAPLGKLPASFETSVAEAAKRSDVFAGGAVAGAAEVDFWQFSDYTVQPKVRNEESRERVFNAFKNCVLARVQALRPRSPDSNLLAALQRAGEYLREGKDGGRLAVISNGYNNTPPLDLRTLIAEGVTPDYIVGQLVAKDELPDLKGIHVVFYGLGEGGPKRTLPRPYRLWVKKVWVAICEQAGGTCEEGGDITDARAVTDAPSDAAFPDLSQSSIIPDARRPVIGDAMFEPGRYDLSGDADVILGPVVEWLRTPGHRAEVVGHSATWGTHDYRRDISRKRADAVTLRLGEMGVDVSLITTDGVGSDEPLVDDTDEDGRLIPEAAIRNRRVEITLTGGNADAG